MLCSKFAAVSIVLDEVRGPVHRLAGGLVKRTSRRIGQTNFAADWPNELRRSGSAQPPLDPLDEAGTAIDQRRIELHQRGAGRELAARVRGGADAADADEGKAPLHPLRRFG